MIWMLGKAVLATTGGRVAIGVIGLIIGLKMYGVSQEHKGAAKALAQVENVANENVKKAEKARAAVRPSVKLDSECVRDIACRDR